MEDHYSTFAAYNGWANTVLYQIVSALDELLGARQAMNQRIIDYTTRSMRRRLKLIYLSKPLSNRKLSPSRWSRHWRISLITRPTIAARFIACLPRLPAMRLDLI